MNPNTASLTTPHSQNLKPPQLIAHLTRLIMKLFYHTSPHFRLIFELLLEGARTPDQVNQMLLGDIESSEDKKMFKEEYMQELLINRTGAAGGDVIDGEMKSFALEATEDLTFNPYGSRLTDQEMSNLLQLPLKEVQGFLGKLVQDKLICVDAKWKPPKTKLQREEERLDGMTRYKRKKGPDPVLYFIDYVQFINVVKLRLAKLEKSIEQVEQEREVDYACESCGQHYNMFQVGVLANQKCTKCGGIVNETRADQNMTDLAEEKRKFEEKVSPLKKLLKDCQEFVIAKNHTHKLKEFVTKAEAEKRRQEEERIMDEENRDRKKRKRMGITAAKPTQRASFAVVSTTTAQPSPSAAAPVSTAAQYGSNQQASILPHFLNSSKMQMEINKQKEEQKKQQEEQQKAREEILLKQQQQQEDERRQEELLLMQQQDLLVEEEKDDIADTNPLLSVGGVHKRLDEITSDDVDQMSAEEYDVYEAHASAQSGTNGVEMSDDF
eukprot:CAMPEP_0117452122 /NCGR_PEP_ID=MMETSP0759-20121206/9416_1 /TAXON_ID=63605 /ORGANISM="Percolomonas cosmopolitus, Strain WS" /LENGTH=494 /DNA_ID=CAMNT_0005244855 /DNA_START=39 /DNA_END=1523 /DNA_ORIENTATION=-